MKCFTTMIVGLVFVLTAAGVVTADPYYVNFVDQDGGGNTLISYYALAPGSLVETFDGVGGPYPVTPISSAAGLDQPWTWGAGVNAENDAVVIDSVSGRYAAPWSHITNDYDETPYATVPYDATLAQPRQASVAFGADYRYLGLHWGSMDAFDGQWAQKIDLYDDGSLVATVTAPVPADGDWTDEETNRYVNIFLTDDKVFDTAVFQSNKYAFEFDNLAVGTVPVPGAALLGLLGLSAAGARLRRRRA